jgi:hypothetical protein
VGLNPGCLLVLENDGKTYEKPMKTYEKNLQHQYAS